METPLSVFRYREHKTTDETKLMELTMTGGHSAPSPFMQSTPLLPPLSSLLGSVGGGHGQFHHAHGGPPMVSSGMMSHMVFPDRGGASHGHAPQQGTPHQQLVMTSVHTNAAAQAGLPLELQMPPPRSKRRCAYHTEWTDEEKRAKCCWACQPLVDRALAPRKKACANPWPWNKDTTNIATSAGYVVCMRAEGQRQPGEQAAGKEGSQPLVTTPRRGSMPVRPQSKFGPMDEFRWRLAVDMLAESTRVALENSDDRKLLDQLLSDVKVRYLQMLRRNSAPQPVAAATMNGEHSMHHEEPALNTLTSSSDDAFIEPVRDYETEDEGGEEEEGHFYMRGRPMRRFIRPRYRDEVKEEIMSEDEDARYPS